MCTMIDPERELTSVSSRPLCRSYALVIAAVTPVRLRDAGHSREHPLFWVFGWLTDGECEPLGACVGVQALPQMLAGLKSRGVQRIWRVAALDTERGADVERVKSTIAREFPRALASATSDLPPVALAVAAEVRETVMRAIRRHRQFEDEAQALDIVELALQRAERRLDGERRMAA
jgi:hypothetical protein